jgi:hypothetical protein
MADIKAQHDTGLNPAEPIKIAKFDYDINPSDLYIIVDQVLNKDGAF